MSPDATLGTCYGYAIRSSLPFRFLRGGKGEPLDVFVDGAADRDPGRMLEEWVFEEGARQEIRIYGDGTGYRIWSTALGWFAIDPRRPSVRVPDTNRDVAREQMALVTSLALCFHDRGDLPVHAAAVEVGQQAVILAGPGMFGKTTLAAAFWRAGHRVLTEDLVCLRQGEPPAVLPGPAMLRLRRDVAEQMDLEDTEVVLADHARVCLAFAPSRRGDSDPVPVRAVVFPLASEDELRLERVDGATALRDLWALCGLFADDPRFAEGRFAAVADLVAKVPVYNLYRPVRFEALDHTVELVVREL